MEIRHYLTRTGRDPFQRCLDRLKDLPARVAIQRRGDRLASDNLGDHRFCGEAVWELRIDVGPGDRVYFARAGRALVLPLCGGDKRTPAEDIATAIAYWQDYLRGTE